MRARNVLPSLLLMVAVTGGFAQHINETQIQPVLLKLSAPVFPELARSANLFGDVVVRVNVHPDGSTDAIVVSGHPMLKQAALDSATQSTFECSGCVANVEYSLVYSFVETHEGNCCEAHLLSAKVERQAEISNEQGVRQTRIIIAAEHGCLCDPAFRARKRVRSAKCLYLWKCSES